MTEPGIDAFLPQALDRPGAYRINVGHGSALTNGEMQDVASAAHAAGLTQGELDKLLFLRGNGEQMSVTVPTLDIFMAKVDAEVQRRWGAEHDRKLAFVAEEANRLHALSPTISKWLSTPTIGGNPLMAELLATLGERRLRSTGG